MNYELRTKNGFTLIELLVALMVTSIVFSAVVTLTYALGTANEVSGDTAQKQAQVRFATLRISELIRHCKLICKTSGDDLAVWRADDNGDGQINVNELTYIGAGPGRDHIRLYECSNVSNPAVGLSEIDSVGTSWWLGFYDSDAYVALIPQCNNVQFQFDQSPPNSRFVSISFDLVENEGVRRYQMNAALRGWAGNLLDGSGEIVSDDD